MQSEKEFNYMKLFVRLICTLLVSILFGIGAPALHSHLFSFLGGFFIGFVIDPFKVIW